MEFGFGPNGVEGNSGPNLVSICEENSVEGWMCYMRCELWKRSLAKCNFQLKYGYYGFTIVLVLRIFRLRSKLSWPFFNCVNSFIECNSETKTRWILRIRYKHGSKLELLSNLFQIKFGPNLCWAQNWNKRLLTAFKRFNHSHFLIIWHLNVKIMTLSHLNPWYNFISRSFSEWNFKRNFRRYCKISQFRRKLCEISLRRYIHRHFIFTKNKHSNRIIWKAHMRRTPERITTLTSRPHIIASPKSLPPKLDDISGDYSRVISAIYPRRVLRSSGGRILKDLLLKSRHAQWTLLPLLGLSLAPVPFHFGLSGLVALSCMRLYCVCSGCWIVWVSSVSIWWLNFEWV